MTEKVLEKYSWIHNNFFESSLRKLYSDNTIYLKTFLVKSQTTKRNETYWCDIINFELNYNNGNEVKSRNVTLKIGYFNAYMDEMMEKYSPFKREICFYQKVVPKIEELLLSVGDNGDFIENAIAIVNERPQPKFLLLEDFTHGIFSRAERQGGLDLSHLKLALEKLAKFHASTAVLNSNDSEIFAHHQQPNISEYFKIFHSLFTSCIKAIIKESSTEIAEKLSAFERNMIDKASEAFMLKNDDFGVLCHGDLWIDNLVFSYDDRFNPVDVKFINFGLSYFGSPAIDLSYLLFTSSSENIRDYEIDILLQFYHKKLHENLMKMDYDLPIPSLIQIHNYFLRSGVIGVLYSSLLLPMRFASLSDFKEFLENSEEAQKKIFNDAALKGRLEFLIDYFDRKGFLE